MNNPTKLSKSMQDESLAPVPTRIAVEKIVSGRSERLYTLDSIRGVAAFIVVIHHCFLTQPAFSDFFFTTWRTEAHGTAEYLLFHTPLRLVWSGYEAVTLFYVLSGLVLALPWVEGRPPTYRSYAIKRMFRIYLPYGAAIAVAACLNIALRSGTPVPGASQWVNELTWSNPVTPFSVVDHVLMLGHRNSIDGVIHSLIWEMRVSLLFPFLMVPLVLWRARGAAVSAACLLIIIACFQLTFAPPGSSPLLLESSPELGRVGKIALEFQWTAYYALFFVLGSLLTMYLGQIRRWLSRARWAGAACLVVGLLIFQAHWSRIHPLQETMVALGSALIIIAGLAPGRIEAVLSHRWLRFLGRISYSLYLVHVPLLLAAVILLQGRVPMVAILICVPPVAVALGWLFDELVAQPCVRMGHVVAAKIGRPRPRMMSELETGHG